MFGTRSIKLDKAVFAKLERYAKLAGYASPEELVLHLIERELSRLDGADSEEEIKKRLRGLGYIS